MVLVFYGCCWRPCSTAPAYHPSRRHPSAGGKSSDKLQGAFVWWTRRVANWPAASYSVYSPSSWFIFLISLLILALAPPLNAAIPSLETEQRREPGGSTVAGVRAPPLHHATAARWSNRNAAASHDPSRLRRGLIYIATTATSGFSVIGQQSHQRWASPRPPRWSLTDLRTTNASSLGSFFVVILMLLSPPHNQESFRTG